MRITILGKSPAWQDAGGACSGYLVEQGDTAVLIDCGNGVFGKLRLYHDYVDVDAVVISHLHADHYFDLVPYSFALTHAPRQQPVPVPPWPGTDSPARPRLYGPPGALGTFRSIGGLLGFERLIEDSFEATEYDPAQPLILGDPTSGELTLNFHSVPHFIEAYAIDITGPGGGRVTFGADCRPGEELIEAARDTDLLFAEATIPRPERSGVRGHLTPAEAAEHGRLAGAGRVVLTHISDEIDPAWALEQATAAFDGEIALARAGDTYEV